MKERKTILHCEGLCNILSRDSSGRKTALQNDIRSDFKKNMKNFDFMTSENGSTAAVMINE